MKRSVPFLVEPVETLCPFPRVLSEITGTIRPLATNVGLIGWSYGGVTSICAAGIHASSLNHLAWILNWESPVGDGMPTAEAGADSSG